VVELVGRKTFCGFGILEGLARKQRNKASSLASSNQAPCLRFVVNPATGLGNNGI